MKKTLYLLFITFLLSCNNNVNNKVVEDNTKDEFIRIVSNKIKAIFDNTAGNSIDKELKESSRIKATKDYYNSITSFADSVLIVHNWLGKVEKMEYSKGESFSTVLLDILIEYKGKQHIDYGFNEITLHCIYTVDNKYKNCDKTFNNMAKIQRGSVVYFNGLFSRSMNGHISTGESFKALNFILLDINTLPLQYNPIKSILLKNAISRKMQEMKILGNCMLSGKDVKKESKYLNIDSVMKTLPDSDKIYVNKIERAYLLKLVNEYSNKP